MTKVETRRQAEADKGNIIAILLVWTLLFVDGARGETPVVEKGDRSSATATIDRLLASKWREQKIEPAPLADDAEFLRRVTLDLVGRIPRVAEVQDFLASTNPDKRRDVVEQLLADPAHVTHFTNVWRAILLTQASAQDLRFITAHLENWLNRRVRENVPYDQMVREILTTPLGDKLAVSAASQKEPTPLAFYQANELKPENLASAVSRVFLGVNLECAQCHNHPFAPWKQEQFWQLSAFFAGVQRLRPDNAFAAAPEMMDNREMKIPGSDRLVTARFLDGTEPKWDSGVSSRGRLAEWVTSANNPYFARNAVNRLWAHFFGRGIVEPLDELGRQTEPLHAELLDALARQFVTSGYDVRSMLRTITASDAYQRTSRLTHPSQKEAGMFARAMVRGMTAEQFFDSLALATGCKSDFRASFLTKFNRLDRPTESQTSILQALAMMNGQLTAEATSLSESKTVLAVVDAPFLSVEQKIAVLSMATVSREPSATELERFTKYVAESGNRNEALADVFWALLNSSEFMLNR